jgi:hypothetical protein
VNNRNSQGFHASFVFLPTFEIPAFARPIMITKDKTRSTNLNDSLKLSRDKVFSRKKK